MTEDEARDVAFAALEVHPACYRVQDTLTWDGKTGDARTRELEEYLESVLMGEYYVTLAGESVAGLYQTHARPAGVPAHTLLRCHRLDRRNHHGRKKAKSRAGVQVGGAGAARDAAPRAIPAVRADDDGGGAFKLAYVDKAGRPHRPFDFQFEDTWRRLYRQGFTIADSARLARVRAAIAPLPTTPPDRAGRAPDGDRQDDAGCPDLQIEGGVMKWAP